MSRIWTLVWSPINSSNLYLGPRENWPIRPPRILRFDAWCLAIVIVAFCTIPLMLGIFASCRTKHTLNNSPHFLQSTFNTLKEAWFPRGYSNSCNLRKSIYVPKTRFRFYENHKVVSALKLWRVNDFFLASL